MPKGKKTVNNGAYTSPEKVVLREQEAAEWMLANPDTSWQDFIDHFKGKWNLQRNQVNLYRKAAFKRLNEMIDENLLAAKKISSASMMKQLKAALDTEDPKLALEIRKEMNKVLGLYVQNVDVTSAGKQLEGFDISKLITFSKANKDDGDIG